MGILSVLGNVDIGKILTSAREAITGKGITDPTKMAEISLQLQQLEQANAEGQLKINNTEAASGNWFIAGARPFMIWVCGFAFAWQFVIGPMLAYILEAFGHKTPLPILDMSEMMPALLGLLGLGGMRTVEKMKGVNGNHG